MVRGRTVSRDRDGDEHGRSQYSVDLSRSQIAAFNSRLASSCAEADLRSSRNLILSMSQTADTGQSGAEVERQKCPALRESAHHLILRTQRMSAKRAATAASGCRAESPLWAVPRRGSTSWLPPLQARLPTNLVLHSRPYDAGWQIPIC